MADHLRQHPRRLAQRATRPMNNRHVAMEGVMT